MSRRRTAEEWKREVSGWRTSGQSAAQYAARRGYSSASLWRWAKLAESGAVIESPRFARLEVRTAPPAMAALTVEVGRALVRVERGFDAEHLRAVVETLMRAVPT
jgi:hypothetical protein